MKIWRWYCSWSDIRGSFHADNEYCRITSRPYLTEKAAKKGAEKHSDKYNHDTVFQRVYSERKKSD